MENNNFKNAETLLALFITQCITMAGENWCPSQVDMLNRLFRAVLKGVPYDEWERNDES